MLNILSLLEAVEAAEAEAEAEAVDDDEEAVEEEEEVTEAEVVVVASCCCALAPVSEVKLAAVKLAAEAAVAAMASEDLRLHEVE